MASMIFVMNDSSTENKNPVVQVTITENPGGTLTFTVVQLVAAGNYLGDLRGLFFDVKDEALLGTLSVAGATKTLASGAAVPVAQPAWTSGNDSVNKAGSSSNNMNGLLGSDGGYDFGIEIGSEGIGKNGDEVRAFTFTLDSSQRDLKLADFGSVDFGVRITSIGRDVDGNGTIDGSRNNGTKIHEISPPAPSGNAAPVAAADSHSTSADTPLAGNVLSNDSDPDGNPLSASLVSGPAHGTLVLNADGSFTYTPDANFNGSDSFTYRASDGSIQSNVATVDLSIASVNDAPVAVADGFGTAEDTPLTGNVLANDSDPNDTPPNALMALLVDDVQHGTLTLDSDGSFSYTPDPDYHGGDSFTYRVLDDGGTSNGGSDTGNTVSVSIDIAGINDVPLLAADPNVPYQFTEIAGATGGATVHTVSGSLDFSDVDLADIHSAAFALDVSSFEFVEADNTPAGGVPSPVVSALTDAFTLIALNDSTGSGGGSLDWSFSEADSTFDFCRQASV
ncbi:MAG TPA: cadherin-like domain-containing protein [Burkholderiales bacterium]|nr:cadherin-like domain-containing protein [Burkholderiales bacterium]